jgi:hypothetical protein
VIGFDYPKIEFQLLGFELLEPMALITDSILGLLSLYFAYKVSKITSELSFYRYWKLFFIFFGIGILLGGIGHTFYNQLGMYGKVQGWFLAPFAIYLSEQAMISIHWDDSKKKLLNKLSVSKVILVYIVFVIFLITSEESKLSTQPFLPIAINTIIGFIGFVGLLGVRYTQNISVKFKYFWLGIIILFPTALIFLLKVNLHPYFNKNDFSHLIFCVGITYFYLGVNGLSKGLKQKK